MKTQSKSLKVSPTISNLLLAIIVCSPFFAFSVSALPGYAIRHGFLECTTCHMSPAGGGPRNTMGKAIGQRGYPSGPFSNQDLWSTEVRGLYFSPQNSTSGKGGMGIMAGNVSANLPVQVDEKSRRELRLVMSHNVGGFPGGAGSPREMFLRWMYESREENTLLPEFIVLGRFVAPFGLLTDEHRTYTKLQTKSTWNDLDMGAMFSGHLGTYMHYDLALLNGQKTAGASLSQGNAATFGGVLNTRFISTSFPLGFGLSGLHYEKVKDQDSPSAAAGYLMLSLDRLTKDWIKGFLVAEYVIAQGWNSTLNNFFTDPNYQTSLASSESEGWYALLNWEFTERLSLIYKFDQLTPDRRFPSDTYLRHGLGAKYYFGPNFFGQIRVEQAEATHPSEENGTETGALDAGWAYFQISI
ncbi:MAG: hypothetical protein IT288_06265 [Bdellovibrionales bacterium]|nr:hypothetical protein [Bdellovibrionales bacterium]